MTESGNTKMNEFNDAILKGTITWWQMELPSGNVIFGDKKAEMLGFPESMFKNYKDFMDLVHPDDKETAMQAMRDHMYKGAKIYETTYRIKNKNGEYIKFYDCGQIVKKDGENITVIGFVMKVKEGADIVSQMSAFKQMILEGDPSILELVSKLKS